MAFRREIAEAPRLALNDLLAKAQIDPHEVIVFRHRPNEGELRKVFPWIVGERPDLFNAYQQTQGEVVEKALLAASFVISSVGVEPGRATFVGLYSIGKARRISEKQYWSIPEYQELRELGMRGFSTEKRSTCLFFEMAPLPFYSDWRGKLVFDWPPPERSWWRRAHRNTFQLRAILEESTFQRAMLDWDKIDLSWSQLSLLPKSWQAKLREWRGIYYIFDEADAKGYVGSAYGGENILGRWRSYGKSGHGDNKLLRDRDPRHFRFSILQLVSPTMSAAEVQALEANWKERLHTRFPSGLNKN